MVVIDKNKIFRFGKSFIICGPRQTLNLNGVLCEHDNYLSSTIVVIVMLNAFKRCTFKLKYYC